jgi:hypothetical protein
MDDWPLSQVLASGDIEFRIGAVSMRKIHCKVIAGNIFGEFF